MNVGPQKDPNHSSLALKASVIWRVIWTAATAFQYTFNDMRTVQMFGDSAPPIDWDTAGEYTRKNISVFYLSHAGTVLREDQIVDVLKGGFPNGYVETGCQARLLPCCSTLPLLYALALFRNWLGSCWLLTRLGIPDSLGVG